MKGSSEQVIQIDEVIAISICIVYSIVVLTGHSLYMYIDTQIERDVLYIYML